MQRIDMPGTIAAARAVAACHALTPATAALRFTGVGAVGGAVASAARALAHWMRLQARGRAAAILVASTWVVHGLYNKLLDGSPRHLQIVQATPGLDGITGEHVLAAVGVGEVVLAAWVLAGVAPFWCASVQTAALLAMNVVELTFARHLLLWPAGLIPANVVFLAVAWIAARRAAASSRAAPVTPHPAASLILSASRAPTAAAPLTTNAPLTRRVAGPLVRMRRHPVPVRAHFDECLTLTYALPATLLRPLLPDGLELDTLRGHGFAAVALVRTRSLRPAALPAAFGQEFFLAGYRLFTTFRRPDGRRLRGLRILRSDADRLAMVLGGNVLTHYQYRWCQASCDGPPAARRIRVRTRDGRGDLDLTAGIATTTLPPSSPFASMKEARRFAGPLPFTFDYEPETHAIVAIEATRANWRPEPVSVHVRKVTFFDRPEFGGTVPLLAAAFRVRDIDYAWQRGRLYPLPPEGA